jgi:hypothetical protein
MQSDQKENKSEQALQIIGHVVAEFFGDKRSIHRRRQFVVLLNNKSYLMNFRRWNYNLAFYYYLIMEEHFTFVRMGNLPALLPNVTPLVSRFFGELSVLKLR